MVDYFLIDNSTNNPERKLLDSLAHRALTSPFLSFFGKYSYCLYVAHQPLMILFVKIGIHTDKLTGVLGSKFLAVLAVNVLAAAFSVAIALLSWNLYEKQWLKLKDLPFLNRQAESRLGEKSGTAARLTNSQPPCRVTRSETIGGEGRI